MSAFIKRVYEEHFFSRTVPYKKSTGNEACLEHLERHFGNKQPGSLFIPNMLFSDARSLIGFLDRILEGVLVADLPSLDYPWGDSLRVCAQGIIIGESALTEIRLDDRVVDVIRDEGLEWECHVKLVDRKRKPAENILVLPEIIDSGDGCKFWRISTAYPGELTPAMPTNGLRRLIRAGKRSPTAWLDAQNYWSSHGFCTLPASLPK